MDKGIDLLDRKLSFEEFEHLAGISARNTAIIPTRNYAILWFHAFPYPKNCAGSMRTISSQAGLRSKCIHRFQNSKK